VLIVISAGRMLNAGWMLLACLLAALAAFSNFVGVVACLILPVVALHQRSRLSVLVLVFFLALVSLFFYGIESGAPAGTTAMGKLGGQLASLHQWPILVQEIATSVGLHLGAPVSASHPVVASIAVLGSVFLLGYLWLLMLYNWSSGQEPGPRSIEFCLVMATICLGLSCAIPLARDALNDPLSDRYQTTTVIYWLSISCLIYFKARDLEGGTGLKQVLVLLACVPVLPVLGAFTSGLSPSILVLNREANSAQILGQLGANFFEHRKAISSRMRASYIAGHMEFLSAFGFEPIEAQAIVRERLQVDQPSCEGFWLEAAPSAWPGMQAVRLRPSGISKNPFLSRLDVRGSNGELGRLHAHVQRDHDLRAIAFDERVWRGFYRGEVAASAPLTLYVNPVIGRGYQCLLSEK
jgi:hypothetical protein